MRSSPLARRLTRLRRVCRLVLVLLAPALATAARPAAVAAQPPSARVAYLIDFASATLDFVDLVDGSVHLGFLPVGAVPNQVRAIDGSVYVVNSVPANLQIIDLVGPQVEIVDLAPGSNPWAVAVVGRKAYVSLWSADQVAVVDLDLAVVTGLIDVGRSPEGMAVSAGRLYVANSGFLAPGVYAAGSVSVIDLATDQVVATIPVGLNPQWCAADGEGELEVVCSGRFGADAGQVYVVDPVLGAAVDSLHVGGFPGPIAVASSGVAYMVEYTAGLLAVDTVSNTVLHDVTDPIPVGGVGALGLAIDGLDRTHVAVSADGLLTVIEPDGTLAEVFAVGAGPQDVDLLERTATAVTLTSFQACRRRDRIELEWRTADAVDHLGFHVERRRAGAATFARLTPAPVRADGGRYVWVDRSGSRGRLEYRLIGVDRRGAETRFGPFAVPAASPALAALRAGPNPLRIGAGAARLSLRLAAAGPVDARVLDVAGRPVRRLLDGPLAAGVHTLTWDLTSDRGHPIAAGTYFVQVVAGGARRLAKLTVVH